MAGDDDYVLADAKGVEFLQCEGNTSITTL